MGRKLTWIGVIGFGVAVGLVVFGTIENLLRTIRYGLEKAGEK